MIDYKNNLPNFLFVKASESLPENFDATLKIKNSIKKCKISRFQWFMSIHN